MCYGPRITSFVLPKLTADFSYSLGQVCDFGPGLPFKKKVQLYSRTSGRFIQIKKTELDARGKNGSQYGKGLVNLCLTG